MPYVLPNYRYDVGNAICNVGDDLYHVSSDIKYSKYPIYAISGIADNQIIIHKMRLCMVSPALRCRVDSSRYLQVFKYRDGVFSLGEAVDTGINSVYGDALTKNIPILCYRTTLQYRAPFLFLWH